LSGRTDCFSDSIAAIVVLVSFVAWPDPIRCKGKNKNKNSGQIRSLLFLGRSKEIQAALARSDRDR
jgi:hypothetical protein